MVAKTFTLGGGDNPEGTSGSWSKFCMFMCCFIILGVIIVVAIYAYNSNFGGETGSGCGAPPLDENGLSNWTSGAEMIAYACFPGYFLEGNSNVLVSACENNFWSPSPPACNFLPLRLDCEINYRGLVGNVTMWQEKDTDPTFILGMIDYTDAVRTQGHLLHVIYISKGSCSVFPYLKNIEEQYPDPPAEASSAIKINFKSSKLKAYNKAEIHVNLIFVDKNTTASLVSVHQDDITLVMPNSIISKRRISKALRLQYGL